MLHTLTALKPYRKAITLAPLAKEIRQAWSIMRSSKHWAPLSGAVSDVTRQFRLGCDIDTLGETIKISLPDKVAPQGLDTLLKKLSPWRIGPYQIGATLIDSEWRSEMKWERVAPLIGEVSGARIADVGCNNGYFLFKLLNQSPEVLIGLDPIERCWLQAGLLHGLTKKSEMAFLPSGIATIDCFPAFFDLILCMGVIYHQRDPFTACKKLFAATRVGGRVVLESLVIQQSGSYLLVPNDRYAKMRNAWIVPTPEALVNLLERAGFSDLTLHLFGAITTKEQRRTPWAPYESLADFLDPNDPSKTVEGYPAPHSAVVVGTKP